MIRVLPGDSTPPSRGGVSVRGVRVSAGPSWWLLGLLAPSVVGDAVAAGVPGASTQRSYLLGMSAAGMLLVAAGVHEAARAGVLALLGRRPRRVVLLPMSSRVETSRPADPRAEALAALAGVLALTTAGWAAAIGWSAAGTRGTTAVLLAELTLACTGSAALHLLPAAPLDGGALLRAALRARGRGPGEAEVVAARSGRACALVVMAGALAVVVLRPAGSTVAALVVAVTAGGSVHAASNRELAAAGARLRLPLADARRLTRPAVPAHAQLPLAVALVRTHEAGAGGIVVVDGDGRPTGVVDERAVAAVPPARRPWTSVADVARPLDGRLLGADLGGEALLATMRARPGTEYLVVEPDGSVLGVLAAADVARTVLT